jgi:hypothetical protein
MRYQYRPLTRSIRTTTSTFHSTLVKSSLLPPPIHSTPSANPYSIVAKSFGSLDIAMTRKFILRVNSSSRNS